MDIWKFIPAVKRPWNPAYRHVWDSMTHRERQISFLIDCAIVLLVLTAFVAGHRFGQALYR